METVLEAVQISIVGRGDAPKSRHVYKPLYIVHILLLM